jgi:hypothetical protein
MLHAARFLLVPGVVRLSRWWTWLTTVAMPALAASAFCWSAHVTVLEAPLLWIPTFIFCALVATQYVALILTLRNVPAMFAFYERLAQRRAEATGGITDSYRHLREHGNSLFIVICEVLLGFALLLLGVIAEPAPRESDQRPMLFLMFFILWTMPAVLVWFIATLLERDFSLSPRTSLTPSIPTPIPPPPPPP